MLAEVENIQFMQTPAGEILGFVTPDGRVYLDIDNLRADTPIHEFGHLWNGYIKQNHPELWEKGKELIKNSPYWQQTLGLIESNPDAYGHMQGNEDKIADEALATAIGNNGADIFNGRNRSVVSQFKAWLRQVWDRIMQKAGIRDLTPEQVQKLTLDKFLGMASEDLLSGRRITLTQALAEHDARIESSQKLSEGENEGTTPARQFNVDIPNKYPPAKKKVIQRIAKAIMKVLPNLKGVHILGGDGFLRAAKQAMDGRFNFVGQKAAFEKAKNSLQEAKKLFAENTDGETIFEKTGWFKDANDGKWKYELPNNAKLLPIEIKSGENKLVSLDKVLDFPELYEAYPEAKKIKVYYSDLVKDGNVGGYDSKTNTIYLDNGTTTNPNTGKKVNPQSFASRQTLVHELQHFIQGKEGFAKGANISKGRERVASEIRRLGTQAEQIRRLITTQNAPQYATAPLREYLRNTLSQIRDLKENSESYAHYYYRGYAGEIEAKNAERRMDDGLRGMGSPNRTADKFSPQDKTVQFMRKPDGTIYGFVQDGHIYLNGDKLNANTTVHESGHLFMQWAKDNAPDLHREGLDKMDGTQYLKAVQADKFYVKQAEQMRQQGASEAEILDFYRDEALARAIGDSGQKMSIRMKSAFRQWLNDFWNAIKEAFGKGSHALEQMSAKEIRDMKLTDFSDAVAERLLSGKPLTESDSASKGQTLAEMRATDLALSERLRQDTISWIDYYKKQADAIKADIRKVLSGENKQEDIELFDTLTKSMSFTKRDMTEDVYERFNELRKDYDIDSLLDRLSQVQKRIAEDEATLKELDESDKRANDKYDALEGRRTYYMAMPDGTRKQVRTLPDVVNGFYSPIEKKLLDTKTDRQSVRKWMELIGKKDEAVFTGVKDWLESMKPDAQLSKAEIQDFMKDNRIEVVEVVKEQGEDDTKFSEYQLPGDKETYKEVLVKMPEKEPRNLNDISREMYGKEFNELNDEEANKVVIKEQREKSSQNFRSPHFDEPNILVHMRMNTRTDSEGNKVLFLEEVQSEWGQKGRKEGFQESRFVVTDAFGSKVLSKNGERGYAVFKDKKDAEKHIEEMGRPQGWQIKVLPTNNIPTAPFVTDTNAWTKLGLKVALKEAVAQGADKIAWTTGEQQNERYDLSKHVDEITYSKYPDGTYQFAGSKNDNQLFNYQHIQENKLEDYVGKEVAKKMIESKGEIMSYGNKDEGTYGELGRTLSGIDLKVGGSGMKGFYGSPSEGTLGIIGKVAKSLWKQEPKTVEIVPSHEDLYSVISDHTGTSISDGLTLKEAEALIKSRPDGKYYLEKESPTTNVQHAITITPEMRAEAQEGQSLFMAEGDFKENPLTLYDEKGRIKYDELKRGTDAIERGTARIDRLSLAEEQGRRGGGRGNAEASLIVSANRRTGAQEQRAERERQEKALKEAAQSGKTSLKWFTPEQVNKWEQKDEGNESRIYKDPKNEGYFLKVGYNYLNFYDTPQDFLDNKVTLGNHIFRDTGTTLELVGFTETHGANGKGSFFAPVYRQKIIEGRELGQDEGRNLRDEMVKRGFKENANGTYVNKDYVIRDLHTGNVIIDKDGNYHFIDTVPSLNTPENGFGGTREYGSGDVVSTGKGSFNAISGTAKEIVQVHLDQGVTTLPEILKAEAKELELKNVSEIPAGYRRAIEEAYKEGARSGEQEARSEKQEARSEERETQMRTKAGANAPATKIATTRGKSQTKNGEILNDKGTLETERGKMSIPEYVSRAKTVLSKLFPEYTFETYETEEEYEAAGGVGGSRGTADRGNNRIMLNLL